MNFDEFKTALAQRGATKTLIDLRTKDGLTITIGQKYSDAMTVGEVFLRDNYVQGLTLNANPVVVDLGGFVGDFALYAVKRLNARRVIVCEPSPRNWALLLKNIAANGYEDQIEPVNKAVTNGRDVMMNVEAADQSMVTAYPPSAQPLAAVSGISLAKLLEEHNVESVDFLKIDCEGGEYEIIESTPSEVFRRIRNVVFEIHAIDGSQVRLHNAKQRLRDEGFILHFGQDLVFGTRP